MPSILILRDANEKLSDIEHFLRSRDFKVMVVHNAQDAIRFITERRPDYSLISMDLLPQNCHWLLGVLNQLTVVITFYEKVSARNLAIIKELNGSHLLEPPLTPLAMNQILRRIRREQHMQNELTSNLHKTHLWIMSTLSDLSLKAICKPAPHGASVEQVQRATRVNCFRLETLNFSGFLVLAYGKDRQLEPGWIELLQKELKEHLKIFIGPFGMSAPEEVRVEEVKFRDWSKAQSEFILQAIHQDAELVVAFFKDQVGLETKPSAQEGCVELMLKDFPEDQVVDFDVYIYLPQNARFILHTQRGNSLPSAKKQKLIADGVTSVHIPKRSLDEVRKHRTRKFIEESSQIFR